MTTRTEPGKWRLNNFDLIRLGAALLIVWYHGTVLFHLQIPWPAQRLMNALPGVPMFFVLSGFLVAASLEYRRGWRRYAVGRVLRIYPALWICFAVTLVVVGAAGFLPWDFIRSPRFVAWVGAQLSVATTTPPQVRGFGVGTPNPSLWTIAVGLQFYVVLPPLYVALRRLSRRRGNLLLLACVAISMGFHVLSRLTFEGSASHTALASLLHASFLPYFWLFLIGTLVYRNRERVWHLLAGTGIFWSVAYILITTTVLYSGYTTVGTVATEASSIVGLTLLAVAVLSVAFTFPGTASRLLRGNDVSYGLYLFHFLWINAVIEFLPGPHGYASFAIVVLATTVMAITSWILVERRAKRLRPVLEKLLRVRAPEKVQAPSRRATDAGELEDVVNRMAVREGSQEA